MQNLFRRPSGVYFLRLAVPVQLRQVFGRREIVATTGTRELKLKESPKVVTADGQTSFLMGNMHESVQIQQWVDAPTFGR